MDVSEETEESVVLVEAGAGTALSDLLGGGTASLSKRSVEQECIQASNNIYK